MRVIIIGGNPAGLSAASTIRRTHANWEIDVYFHSLLGKGALVIR